jgi:fluoroacetyl-CoA thioesterase
MVPIVPVQQGLRAEVELVVAEADTAISLRSGNVPVLATPRVLALCEEATVAALDGQLEDGQTTVGMRAHLDHLAPTAVGGTVRAEAVVEELEGPRVIFKVSVHDQRGLVAVGRITRVVVNMERFLDKLR